MPHDAEIVQAALRFIERRAGRRRPCRRCGNPITRNALQHGNAWSVCAPCEEAIIREATQRAFEPPLIRRCLVCGGLLEQRRRQTKTCGHSCRNVLWRILSQHRPAAAERATP